MTEKGQEILDIWNVSWNILLGSFKSLNGLDLNILLCVSLENFTVSLSKAYFAEQYISAT